MCYSTKCKTCNKMTWAGDGQHIDAVRGTVSASQWCTGHARQSAKRGMFSKLFGAVAA